eukprot:tig00000269_g23758.t1
MFAAARAFFGAASAAAEACDDLEAYYALRSRPLRDPSSAPASAPASGSGSALVGFEDAGGLEALLRESRAARAAGVQPRGRTLKGAGAGGENPENAEGGVEAGPGAAAVAGRGSGRGGR